MPPLPRWRARVSLGATVRELGAEFGIALDLGANVHMATIIEGEYGAGRSAAFDVIGAGVIHAFRMGAGPGIRISEPVFRRLPNDQRRRVAQASAARHLHVGRISVSRDRAAGAVAVLAERRRDVSHE